MKAKKFTDKVLSYSLIILFFFSINSILVSCGPFKYKKTDLRKIPGNAREKQQKNIQEGRGFRINNALKGVRGGTGAFEFASSNEMWRASLELLDFTPLLNVDYSGGIIVTDWFTEENNTDAIKITIRFLSNEIRADAIKVIIHKKICKQINNCKIIMLQSTLSQEIKLAILKKAAILKLKTDELKKDPSYKINEPIDKT